MFKRNQVELAISNWFAPKTRRSSPELKTRIKRLLDADRALERSARSNDPEKANFAFFQDDAPGRGFEVWFSASDAFALLLGLQMMLHGWTQGFVVSVLRQVRPALQKEYDRILKLDPKDLFDAKAIEGARQPGSPAYETAHPSFLVIVSHHRPSADQEHRPYACSIQPNPGSAWAWVQKVTTGVGGGSTMFELTITAHRLAQALERTEPQSRGRPG